MGSFIGYKMAISVSTRRERERETNTQHMVAGKGIMHLGIRATRREERVRGWLAEGGITGKSHGVATAS